MRAILSVSVFLLMLACQNGGRTDSPKEVVKAVSSMINHITEDLSKNGPVIWLQYFDSSDRFFMVNNGSLVFPDFETGKKFIIDTLVKMVQSVQLAFDNIRIDSLSDHAASISAKYHEETKDITGNNRVYDGYFTGFAVLTDRGWKLRNLHWSE